MSQERILGRRKIRCDHKHGKCEKEQGASVGGLDKGEMGEEFKDPWTEILPFEDFSFLVLCIWVFTFSLIRFVQDFGTILKYTLDFFFNDYPLCKFLFVVYCFLSLVFHCFLNPANFSSWLHLLVFLLFLMK